MKFPARSLNLVKAIAIAAILVFAAVPLYAAAQTVAPIEARLEARKIVRAGADEAFASGAEVKPGDVIEYVATFRNTSDKPVRNLQPRLPLPEHTELVPGSARPSGATASLDGQNFAPMPLKRKTVVNGREKTESVPYREYRALRWTPVDIEPGKSTRVSARVKVLE